MLALGDPPVQGVGSVSQSSRFWGLVIWFSIMGVVYWLFNIHRFRDFLS